MFCTNDIEIHKPISYEEKKSMKNRIRHPKTKSAYAHMKYSFVLVCYFIMG